MIARVLRYSFAQARTRARKGTLLGPDDWHYVRKMASMADLWRYLAGTAYAPALLGLDQTKIDPSALVRALYGALFQDYARLMAAVPQKSAALLGSLLSRYEAENIKTILRGLWQGRLASENRSLLHELGPLSRLPLEDLLQCGDLETAVELLQSMPFYSALRDSMAQFHPHLTAPSDMKSENAGTTPGFAPWRQGAM